MVHVLPVLHTRPAVEEVISIPTHAIRRVKRCTCCYEPCCLQYVMDGICTVLGLTNSARCTRCSVPCFVTYRLRSTGLIDAPASLIAITPIIRTTQHHPTPAPLVIEVRRGRSVTAGPMTPPRPGLVHQVVTCLFSSGCQSSCCRSTLTCCCWVNFITSSSSHTCTRGGLNFKLLPELVSGRGG